MNTLKAYKKLSQKITEIEKNPSKFKHMMDIKPHAIKIGVTGSFASGKSTLIANILKLINKKTAVIAIDPENTFNSGAFLGDRMRMQEKIDAVDVFIRSFTTEKLPGSISIPALLTIKLLDKEKFEHIFIETAGSSQQDTFIRDITDILIYVINPGADDYSLIKSGSIELADIIAVTHQDEPHGRKFLNTVKKSFGDKVVGTEASEAAEVVKKIEELNIKPSNRKLKKLFETLLTISQALKSYNES